MWGWSCERQTSVLLAGFRDVSPTKIFPLPRQRGGLSPGACRASRLRSGSVARARGVGTPAENRGRVSRRPAGTGGVVVGPAGRSGWGAWVSGARVRGAGGTRPGRTEPSGPEGRGRMKDPQVPLTDSGDPSLGSAAWHTPPSRSSVWGSGDE